MKKQIFIHIGVHKTGSSSLQMYLIKNAQYLYQNDIYFNESFVPPGKGYHRLLYKSFITKDGISAVADFKKDFENSKCSRAIITDEVWSNPNIVSAGLLKDFLEQFRMYDVQVICFLRHPIDYFKSRYRHLIKMDSKNSYLSFSRWLGTISNNEYTDLLDSIGSSIATDNIKLICYDECKDQNNLLQVFYNNLDIEHNIKKSELERLNNSLSVHSLISIRAVKKFIRFSNKIVNLEKIERRIIIAIKSKNPSSQQKIMRKIIRFFCSNELYDFKGLSAATEKYQIWLEELEQNHSMNKNIIAFWRKMDKKS
jgi:hypothetical protein